jgi:hypothetical protein
MDHVDGRRGWALRLAAAAATAAIAAAASTTPVEAKSPVPPLAARTTITANGPVWMDVRVPRPATIRTPFGPSADVGVVGGGDLALFFLVEQDPDPFVLAGGRVPDGANGTEVALPLSNLPERTGWNYDFVKNYGNQTTVPAGDYRLYVFPDGRRAQLTLRLSGLRGATTLAPRSPAEFAADRPAPRVAAPGPGKNVYSAGSANVLRNDGLIFNALWLKTAPFLAGQFQFCHYEGEDPLDAVAYGPGCPNAKQTSTLNNRRADMEPGTKLLYGGKSSLPPVRHGQGFWYSSEGVVEHLGYVSLWLSYS